MRDIINSTITEAATTAGLPENRVMSLSDGDNLTLPRPRVEIQFLPNSYRRTGRKLAVTRENGVQTTKKELYEVTLDVTANILAEDEQWLAAFEHDFTVAFPRGVNDSRGNWVKIRVEKATFTTPPAKRVGATEIKVFSKVNTLFALRFTGRITEEEEARLMQHINVKEPKIGL
ncbi:MAG: hypothetical protein DELT_02523 [Desulfovibrio sp.]